MCSSDLADTVRLLLAAGSDPNAVDEILLETPLHLAAAYGEVEILQMLIEAGARPERRNKDGVTPLYIAAGRRLLSHVEALLAAGAAPDGGAASGETPFMATLSSRYAPYPDRGDPALVLVELTGDLDRAFASSVWAGRADLARRLAERGAGMNGRDRLDRAALAGATLHPGLDLFELMLSRGADLDRDGPEAIVEAAAAGSDDLVQRLLQLGVAVDARGSGGLTPLLAAAAGGRVDTVRLLLERGADRDAVDSLGRNALELMSSSTGVIEVRIETRNMSRAWRPTEELEFDLSQLEEAHAAIRELLDR